MHRVEHPLHAISGMASTRIRLATALMLALTAAVFAIPSSADGARAAQAAAGNAVRPIRALYVTGGGFHDFVKMQAIVPPAIAERVKVNWTIDHTAGTSTEVLIERHRNTEWAKEFDVVLYNMSFSFVVDVPWIERLAHAHRDSGVGAVILHGAVHSYRRSESKAWGELWAPSACATTRSDRSPSNRWRRGIRSCAVCRRSGRRSAKSSTSSSACGPP